MIGTTKRQASLFYFAFAKEAATITDDLLDPLDKLLYDPQLLDLASQALAKRSARSADFGRPSIAPDRLVRWKGDRNRQNERCAWPRLGRPGRAVGGRTRVYPAGRANHR